tara:strand:+ start:176 stop:595 length:420 start_codon:yes stop_codon:yes gene_type:complete
MEKLKLEHLAPYLPYGLKIIHNWEKVRDSRKEPLKRWIKILEPSQLNIFTREDSQKHFKWKPILRPLSDLTKEIEEGKPMFFPSHQLVKHIENNQDIFNCSYNEINYLLRNHFDAFGLIEKGLAIDINTINEKQQNNNL